jgi:hypothetical protein
VSDKEPPKVIILRIVFIDDLLIIHIFLLVYSLQFTVYR